MARVGVILSGSDYLDGVEIHESIITLLALNRAGAEVACFVPDVAAGIERCVGETLALIG